MKRILDMAWFFNRHHVPFKGPNNRGWLEMACPVCHGENLGWHESRQLFFCWVCGRLPLIDTLCKLTGSNTATTTAALAKCVGTHAHEIITEQKSVTPSKLEYPPGVGKLSHFHWAYLESRGLNVTQTMHEFGPLYGSGVDTLPMYMRRIFAPYIHNGKECSWQARSTRRDCVKERRYMTCPLELEMEVAKDSVYGIDHATRLKWAFIVEGLFDVWKVGPGAVHTYGITWNMSQVATLVGNGIKKVAVCYDNESDAQLSAKKLCSALSCLGIITYNVKLTNHKDPGDMPLKLARKLPVKCGLNDR